MAYFDSKVYDESTGRLYLVYYALPENVLNQNGWGVSGETINRYINTFVGKPVVLKLKDPSYYMDQIQEGNFVHPYAMKGATLQQQMDFQKPFSVGIINDVKLNPEKGYRFDVEITDPKVKAAMVAEENIEKYPKWVSPTIATTEDGLARVWHGVNVTLVDRPAYGFERMKPAGICTGTMEECTVKLRGAGEENNCGFCFGEATLSLIGAGNTLSSQSSEIQNSTTEMVSTNPQGVTGEVTKITKLPGDANNATTEKTNAYTTTIVKRGSEQNPKNEPDNSQPEFKDDNQSNEPTKENPEESSSQTPRGQPDHPNNYRESSLPKSLDEALAVIQQQNDRISQLSENQDKIDKYIQKLEKDKRLEQVRRLVDRRLFKSDEKYEEEVKKVYNWKGISDEEIKSYYDRQLQLEAKVKGASLEFENDRYSHMRSVPDYKGASAIEQQANTENKTSSDNSKIINSYRLMTEIIGGL